MRFNGRFWPIASLRCDATIRPSEAGRTGHQWPRNVENLSGGSILADPVSQGAVRAQSALPCQPRLPRITQIWFPAQKKLKHTPIRDGRPDGAAAHSATSGVGEADNCSCPIAGFSCMTDAWMVSAPASSFNFVLREKKQVDP